MRVFLYGTKKVNFTARQHEVHHVLRCHRRCMVYWRCLLHWRYWCRTFDEIVLAKLAETLAKRTTAVLADGVEYRVVAEHGCETVASIRRMTSNSTSGLRSRRCEAVTSVFELAPSECSLDWVGRESTTYPADVPGSLDLRLLGAVRLAPPLLIRWALRLEELRLGSEITDASSTAARAATESSNSA